MTLVSRSSCMETRVPKPILRILFCDETTRKSAGRYRRCLKVQPRGCLKFDRFCEGLGAVLGTILGSALGAAGGATAARRLEVEIEIFLAVIESDLLARLDAAQRHEHHLAVAQPRLRVGVAAMIDVAAEIAPRRTVDGPMAVDLEHIFGAEAPLALLRFGSRDALAAVGNDVGAGLDRSGREQAEPGRRAPDTEWTCGHGLRLPADSRDVTHSVSFGARSAPRERGRRRQKIFRGSAIGMKSVIVMV